MIQIPFKFVDMKGPTAIKSFFDYYAGKDYTIGCLHANCCFSNWCFYIVDYGFLMIDYKL